MRRHLSSDEPSKYDEPGRYACASIRSYVCKCMSVRENVCMWSASLRQIQGEQECKKKEKNKARTRGLRKKEWRMDGKKCRKRKTLKRKGKQDRGNA